MRPTTTFAAIVSLAAGVSTFATPPIYVDANAPGPLHDGSTWRTAFTDLQDAIERAYTGAIIQVASGVYRPDRGTGDRTATFRLHGGVTLRGGYAGFGAANPDERNPEAYATILTGDLAGDDEPGFLHAEENSIHVVTCLGGDRGAYLCGFVISGGNANGVEGFDERSWAGGAMLIQGTDSQLDDCILHDNRAISGGAICSCEMSWVWVRNCRLFNNTARRGGALFNEHPASAQIEDSLLEYNTAETGGAIASGGALILRRCVLRTNSAEKWGGAVAYTYVGRAELAMPLEFQTSIFAGNFATWSGGAVFADEIVGSVAMYNCALVGNSATKGGGIYSGQGIELEIANSVLWHNSDLDGLQTLQSQIEQDGAYVRVVYSTIQGYQGNEGADPLFADETGPDGIVGTADDDLRLSPGSPAIDSGDNNYAPEWEIDLDGNPRRIDDPFTYDHGNGQAPIVDRGPYEYQALDCDSPELDCDDGDACTEDVCKPTAGCVHIPMICTAGYRCLDGDCIPRCNVTDNDLDGDIDLQDFAIWQNCFTGPQ